MTIGPEAQVGARWWADKIRNGFLPDVGARPGEAMADPMAVGLVGLLQAEEKEGITPEKIDAYEAALARQIQAMLDKGESGYATAMLLGCDYGAGEAHRIALEEAGIRPGRVTVQPWKRTMWVQPGRVTVRDGCRAASVELPLARSEAPSENMRIACPRCEDSGEIQVGGESLNPRVGVRGPDPQCDDVVRCPECHGGRAT